ncbi:MULTISPECIES: hypothetical protein [unclassified Bradyrhizobium]
MGYEKIRKARRRGTCHFVRIGIKPAGCAINISGAAESADKPASRSGDFARPDAQT